MRVLILTQYYPPENTLISPTLARHLQAAGHQVRVLTGYPNYPEGRLFAGYTQRWRARETAGGIETLRVPLWADHSQSSIKRTFNYTSFAATSATAKGFARGADVIYVYATQMTPALGPWLWRLTGGAPYVLHIQDLWPDSITGSSIIGGGWSADLIRRLMNPWLRAVYRNASAVIGIAPTMVKTLIQRGSDPRTTHLIYNWADETSLGSTAASLSTRQSNSTNLLYAGNVGDMQDLETVVAAVHRTRDAGVRLTIVGDGVALIRRQVDTLGSENVTFLDRVPRNEMRTLYANADFSLVTLKDLPNFRGTIPSKLQASLSHATPVITTVQGDVRTLVDKLQIGFTADTENAASLEFTLRRVAALSREQKTLIAERAQKVYFELFSQASGTTAITGVLENVALRGSKATERGSR